MKTFKGFDKNMQCRVFQFEIGKTYRHEGEIMADTFYTLDDSGKFVEVD